MSSSRRKIFRFHTRVLLLAGCVLGWAFAVTAATAAEQGYDEPAVAAHLVELSGIDRGLCCVLGGDNLELALELARSGGFYVNLLDARPPVVAGMREAADKEELYGRSLVAVQSSLKKLPYADNMVDLIVTAQLTGSDLEELSHSELLRVLRPRGRAVVGCL